jgi:hypothetical protein
LSVFFLIDPKLNRIKSKQGPSDHSNFPKNNMFKQSHDRRWLGWIVPAALLALLAWIVRFFLRIGLAGSHSAPQAAPDLQTLLKENQLLSAQVQTLQAQLAQAQAKPRVLNDLFLRWKSRPIPFLLFLTGGILVFIPPLLVMLDRWFGNTQLVNGMRADWCRVDFLCRSAYPSYFAFIIPCALALMVLVMAAARSAPGLLEFKSPEGSASLPPPVAPEQYRLAARLELISAAGATLSIASGLIFRRLPGLDLALAMFLYLISRCLMEAPWRTSLKVVRSAWKHWLAPLLAVLALVIFFYGFSSTAEKPWVLALPLAAALVYLFRCRRQFSPVVWVALCALVLFTLNINSWKFAAIGDEYDFYDVAREIATRQSITQIGANLFYGQAVFGSHPYLSSLIQAVSIKFFGTGHFGWDFSNPFLSAVSIIFFFLFFKRFISYRAALLAACFLGGSHYLMNFSKIGYNNLQALLVMSLVLAAAGYAVQSRRPLAFTLLGIAMAGCFYVYPGALYVLVLPVLLLVLYIPPVNRPAFRLWVLMLMPLMVLGIPLLFQPEYWTSKVMGTLANEGRYARVESLAYQIGSNLVYMFFSFLYTPQESHFVVSSYVDPLTALFVLPGLALLLRQVRRSRFALFCILGYFAFLILVGASHDREFPPNTRAFLMLPFFALFAALGLDWVITRLQVEFLSLVWARRVLAVMLVLMVSANLYQAYPVMWKRTSGTPSLETLFLRMLQLDQPENQVSSKTYIFLTDENWNIDGLRLWPDLYNLPPSQAQLVHYEVKDGVIPEQAAARMKEEDALVVIQPWMDPDQSARLEAALVDMGKSGCPVRDTPRTDVRFTFWHAPKWDPLCESVTNW